MANTVTKGAGMADKDEGMASPDPMARFSDFLESQIPMMCKDANIAADNIETFVVNHVEAIRRDERHKVADLLEENGPAIIGFVTDPAKAVALIAYLLRLGG